MGRADPGSPPTRREIVDVTREGSWDEGAINAQAAQIDRCPAGYEPDYYDAYDGAARARCEEALLANVLEAVE